MMLSYLFIGAAPVLLGAVFAALLVWFLAIHVSAFLYRRGFDELVEQSRMIGETAAAEIGRVGVDQWDDILRRKVENASPLLPGLSAAIVPARGRSRHARAGHQGRRLGARRGARVRCPDGSRGCRTSAACSATAAPRPMRWWSRAR